MESMVLTQLISEEEIADKVAQLGKEITERYLNKDLITLCVLKGSFIFYSDLIRQIETDLVCEFLGVSSYLNSAHSSGEVKFTLDLTRPIENKHILLVEDIVDSGLTMNYLTKNLLARNPASLAKVSLLYKPEAIKTPCALDYIGFEIGNEYVVGYGLDYQGHYRNLPYIARVDSIN